VPSPSPSPQTIVDTLLGVAAVFITPDWGALILLIPIGLALLFIAWFAFTIRKFATLGPSRRAPARIQPLTPAHVHMPGGSSAPILVAFGAGALFLGMVVGGIALWIGLTLMVVTLLAWFREALHDYDHLETAQRLPAVVHEGPPPGVHMPGPSIRPLLGALGSAALLGGLVVGGWFLILAVVFLVYTLVGWLVDATAEYRKVVEADATGHLDNIPPRKLPMRALQVFAVLFALVGLWQLGVFPATTPASGETPGTSAGPSGPGTGPPVSGPTAPPGALIIVAKNIAFDTHALEVAAGQPFAIFLRNDDASNIPHDVDIRSANGSTLRDQKEIYGGTAAVYQYEALDAGEYVLICSIHPIPAMTGTLTVK
jgi:plastocyanin